MPAIGRDADIVAIYFLPHLRGRFGYAKLLKLTDLNNSLLSTVSGGGYFGSCVTAAMSEGQDGFTFGASDMRDNDAIGATLPRETGESLPLASLEWTGADFDPTASTRPNQSHAPRQTGAADLENA